MKRTKQEKRSKLSRAKQEMTAIDRNYIAKVKVILSTRDIVIRQAIEATIDVLFEHTIKECNQYKAHYYY